MHIALTLGKPVVVPSFGAWDIREDQPLRASCHIIEKDIFALHVLRRIVLKEQQNVWTQ